ncbi:siderophore-interacting protein [Leifsonia poae]|uniref:siderophore-interacting protein n=1 Tax=Leifsonia poae TaxID=110933 RepID=UPI001CBB3183|nr:siderophore-interacting protein [Leifsonia poae]
MSLLASPVVKTDRPSYRPYRARVARLRRLSPHFVRVTFRSPDFDVFGTDGLDQRIKLVFPLENGLLSDLGVDDEARYDEAAPAETDWYDRWRALPDERRNPIRTYTVRSIDPARRLLDVDFVAHGDGSANGGPASRWLAKATEGDELIIVGPDARSVHSTVGIDWRPGSATDLLLVGDETAAPAIAAILETLPPDRRVHAFIEVPDEGDRLHVDLPSGFAVDWLDRAGGPSGCALIPAVEHWVAEHPDTIAAAAAGRVQQLDEVDIDADVLWELPEHTQSGFYAWIAGESGTVKTIRRLLVGRNGVDRGRVAFMGYWRLGKSGL